MGAFRRPDTGPWVLLGRGAQRPRDGPRATTRLKSRSARLSKGSIAMHSVAALGNFPRIVSAFSHPSLVFFLGSRAASCETHRRNIQRVVLLVTLLSLAASALCRIDAPLCSLPTQQSERGEVMSSLRSTPVAPHARLYALISCLESTRKHSSQSLDSQWPRLLYNVPCSSLASNRMMLTASMQTGLRRIGVGARGTGCSTSCRRVPALRSVQRGGCPFASTTSVADACMLLLTVFASFALRDRRKSPHSMQTPTDRTVARR